MNEYITSDLHFYHKNILKFNKKTRPFLNIDEMHLHIISEWNSKVSDDDLIYHLGDFCFKYNKVSEIVSQLNGNKVFIIGNHYKNTRNTLSKYGETYDYLEIERNKNLICMSHYPMSIWNKSHLGSVMLHGHTHGSYQGIGRTMDVGYDSLGEIKKLDEVVGMCLNRDIAILSHHGR